ncbi:hypothetical protein MA9V2_019 [Chryseobacterium phage MA9V-2]|nr:hypothetical protein MA9V2_019 [Chryseobacterium phage MA9V-2]
MKQLTKAIFDLAQPIYGRLNKRTFVNFEVGDLVDESRQQGMHGYDIDFDVILSNGKPLQREYVWTLEQKQSLILSMLKGIKLPQFHFAIFKESDKAKNPYDRRLFKVIDGKQRLSAIKEFVENKYAIFIGNETYYFSDFDSEMEYKIRTYTIDCSVYYEHKYVNEPKHNTYLTDRELVEWFILVNWAGVQQEAEHMFNLRESLKTK